MGKKDRILAILYIALTGGHLSVSELAKEYQVSSKSIFRDITVVRQFLADNRELVGNAELEYSSSGKHYQLNKVSGLHDREVLVLMKILLGCRALPKEDMCILTDKLSKYLSGRYRTAMVASLHEEWTFYQPVRTENSMLLEKLWKLESCIRNWKSIQISYHRLDGKTVERKLYPMATSFSGYYFYLTAYRSDSDVREAVHYRIDRMKKIEELNEKIPLETEERRGKEMAKMYAQNMFMGERLKIRFLYTGPSVQAVLDRFPTARVVRWNGGG